MMPVYQNEAAWSELQKLAGLSAKKDPLLIHTVQTILEQVRLEGDEALRGFSRQFGDPVLDGFTLSPVQVEEALCQIPEETRQLLQRSAENIRLFAQAVMRSVQPVALKQSGFTVGLDWRPVERVACYVPGGRYPLPSTALMTAITAQVAGVSDIVIVSPDLRPEIIYAGTLAGVKHFYQLGGAQAIAAVAYGTGSIPRVDMVVGPGNAYVTEAKRQLQGVIGIDMLAGPSEVAIIADKDANPVWVAWDLLAQAEHDSNARAYLLTDSRELGEQIVNVLEKITAEKLDLPEHLRQIQNWAQAFIFSSLEDCAVAANLMAPEHLELLVKKPEALKPLLRHYGALFMGYYTPVPVGDYMAGPNHTLPTSRSARFAGGLNPTVFLRAQSWIQIENEAQGQALLAEAEMFAFLEGLQAHASSARYRLEHSTA